jgi:hypothetical protein
MLNQFSINLEKPYEIKVLILYKTPIFLFSSKEKVEGYLKVTDLRLNG